VLEDPEPKEDTMKRDPSNQKPHPYGYCYPDCGCPDSDAFDWDGFAADINGTDVGEVFVRDACRHAYVTSDGVCLHCNADVSDELREAVDRLSAALNEYQQEKKQ